MSRAKKISIGAILLVIMAGFAIGVGPYLIRREIEKRAEDKGVHIKIGDMRVRWGEIELTNVEVSTSILNVKPFTIHDIYMKTSGLRIESILVKGGVIEIEEDAKELAEKIGSRKKSGDEGSGIKVSIEDFEIDWNKPCSGTGNVKLLGVRSESGGIEAESASGQCYGVSWEASGVSYAKNEVRSKSARIMKGDWEATINEVKLKKTDVVEIETEETKAYGPKTRIESEGASLTINLIEKSVQANANKVKIMRDDLQEDINAERIKIEIKEIGENDFAMKLGLDSISGKYKSVTGDGATASNVGWMFWFNRAWRPLRDCVRRPWLHTAQCRRG
jgi:hypothetical protein